MKRKFFTRIVVVLLLVTMLFSVAATTVSAASDTSVTVASETKVHGNTGQRRPYTKNLEEINKKLDALTPEEKTYFQKSVNNLKSAKTADQAASIAVSTLMEIATDSDNVNWKNVGIDAAAGIINLAASCFGFGGVAQAITGPLAGILKDKSPSEIKLLQEHLDEQFEKVNQGIADIREDIRDLSVSVDKSIADAVQALEDAIEAQSAGEKVYAFTFSGEGNFDYTLFKNYLYGTSDSTNELAKYAYYDKLSKAISNNGTDTEIEEYYNALYNSLTTIGNERMPYINVLRQYILEDEYGYSIQRYYYEWLSSNRKMLTDSGKDAEWEAMLFTLDVYKTMLYAEHSLAACDNYFLSKIYLEYGSNPSNDAFYKYTSPEGNVTYVKFSDIKKELNNLNNEEREHALVIQMIEDITYIFNMENSYMVKDADGDFYTINNNDSSIFGQVRSGQTVYMNKLTDELCEMFGFDPQNFTYVWSTGEQNTGALEISDGVSALSVTLCYNGTEIYTVDFEINNNDSFSGGSGTEDDPYLICDASQFALIVMGESGNELHYQLVNDIDFKNAEQSPLGSVENPFEGVLDGNGYAVKNVVIKSGAYVGLFAEISLHGIVKNLVVDSMSISGVQGGMNAIYAGSIAGKCSGEIWNCHIKSSSITISRNTTERNQKIETYVGGFVGICSGKILCSSIESTFIGGYSERNYGASDDDKNQNCVYVGGIAAKICATSAIAHCSIDNQSTIKSQALTYCDAKTTRKPRVYSYSGGLAAIRQNDYRVESYIDSVEIDSNITIISSADRKNLNKGSKDTYVHAYQSLNVVEEQISDFGVTQLIGVDDVALDTNIEKYVATYTLNGNFIAEYGCFESQLYNYNEDFLKTDNLKIQVNGNVLEEYEIIGCYGLDTLKSDKIDGEACVVTVIFTTIFNDKTVMLSVNIPIMIEKIKPSELVIVEKPKTQYSNIGDLITLDGGEFELHWEDGSIDTGINPQIVSDKNITAWGASKVEISYNGISTTYAIAVKCLHEYVNSTVAPTCTTVGCTEAVCSKCNDRYIVDGSVIDEIEHTIVIKNAVTATCVAGSVGYTGDKYCTVCEELIEKGSVINVLPHEYEYLDGNSCKCKVCKDDKSTKAHEYTSVENDKSIIYSCATCGYSYTVEKKTTTDITRVVVGNSYGLVGSDNEIVVYIKMFNNPGITGVSFRIEYDDRLEYVRYERGELLSAASEFEVAQTNGVIGFVAASPDIYVADGNLLKLVFKIPDDAQVMDKYNISIAYTRKQFTGGQANAIDIVTMDGCITAVTHLPGDVNNDGFVDVLDTALVARYVAISNTKDSALMDAFLESQNYNFSEFYADVNLDGYVDLSDLVIMLQYFVGKNVQELTSNEFEVILNPNNGSLELDSVVVKCYDENGKRGTYPELPIPVRPGYRFDGWYLSFDVSDLEAERIQAGDEVYYNPTYLKQTLYAHWTEIYTIEYDANAPANASSVSGSMEDSLYKYDEKKPLASNGFVITGWTFKGWATSPNGAVVYADGAEVSGLAHAGEVITLYAVWEANTYTIKFKNNKPSNASGVLSGTMDSVNCVYDTALTLELVDYSLVGWTFKGWATSASGNVEFKDGADIKNLTDVNGSTITLYAVWEAHSYNIQFNSNKPADASTELTGSMSNITCFYDTAFTLVENDYILEGWMFKGWATTANGEIVYSDLAELNNLTETNGKVITLYAVWGRHAYTVEYNSNKPNMASDTVSGTMEKTACTYDVLTHLSSNNYSLTGWTFKGWANTPNGDVVYLDGAEIKNLTSEVNGNVVLYAVWEANSYTVEFDANKPASSTAKIIGNMEDVTLDYDSEIDLTNKFVLEGWTFLGWATSANGNPIYNDKEIVTNITDENEEVVTLYAIWGTKFYTVKYDANKPDCGCVVNGNMSDTNCSYDVSVTLKPNGYSILGHEFKGWATSPSGTVVYDDGTEVMNLTAEESGVVTLYAVWDLNEYSIEYEENGGLNIGNITYTIHNASSIAITQAVYDSIYAEYMNFAGWYEDAAFANVFVNDLTTNPRNITLYAKWDLCAVYEGTDFSKNTDKTLTGKRIIVDWSKLPTTDFEGITIYISNASEIYFFGQDGAKYNGITISLAGMSEDVFVQFNNIFINGCLCQSDVSADLKVTLECKGDKNSITAPQEKTAITGFASLVFTGSGTMTITGGNGTTAETAGSDGTPGATAIVVNNLIIDMSGELTVVGGDGGNGSEGKTGSATSSGGKGGIGGNGGMAINCQSVSMVNPNAKVRIIGGNGGNGGKGGDITNGSNNSGMYDMADAGSGGNGGNGGVPISISSLKNLTCSSLELKYGNGGNGGDGGQGGDPTVLNNDYDPDQKSAGGHGGNGGNGYVAGNGGNGGQGGGSYGTDRWNTSSGTLWGTSGNGGDGGKGGNIIFGVLYTSESTQLLQTSEDCGNGGKFGKAGRILDEGEGEHGKSGSKGKDGTAGTIDSSYYTSFENQFSEKRS